jgi:putative membrane protein
MAAFWILIVVIIVGLVRGGGARRGTGSGAIRVLEDRYARGEIDREEFLERRRFLLGESPPTEPIPPPEGSP